MEIVRGRVRAGALVVMGTIALFPGVARSFSVAPIGAAHPWHAPLRHACAWRGSSLQLRMASGGGEEGGATNGTSIFEKVGAAGNLRSGGSGFKPPPVKDENEPNFSVKPASENPVLQDAMKNPGANKDVFNDMQKQASFENLVDFPCVFQIKVVGARQGEFKEDILDAIGNVVGVKGADLENSFRDNGKWRSITVQVPVESAEQLYKVYDAIGRDPRVKFKF